uniref:Uncharacterized protein n=1 Tax=Rhizophora mucronata TaxID=61149 RepID=A0A2P2QZQ2_RHIMU
MPHVIFSDKVLFCPVKLVFVRDNGSIYPLLMPYLNLPCLNYSY